MDNYLFLFENVTYQETYRFDRIKIPKLKVTFVIGEKEKCDIFAKLLNGTLAYDEGHIYYNNEDIQSIDRVMLKNQVVTVSESAFLFELTIKENFEAFYEINELILLDEAEMKSILEIVMLKKDLETMVDQLTIDERARLYMAIHMTLFPQVLVYQDHLNPMGIDAKVDFYNQLVDYCKENDISLIVVSEEIEIIEKFQEEMVHLEN